MPKSLQLKNWLYLSEQNVYAFSFNGHMTDFHGAGLWIGKIILLKNTIFGSTSPTLP